MKEVTWTIHVILLVSTFNEGSRAFNTLNVLTTQEFRRIIKLKNSIIERQ